MHKFYIENVDHTYYNYPMKRHLIAFYVVCVFIGSSMCAYAGKDKGINSGKPVPYIGNDEASAEFLAHRIEKDGGGKEERYMQYTRRLAKTLSQFSAADQNQIWYGP